MNTVLEVMVTRTSGFVCFADIGRTQVLKIFRFENESALCLLDNSVMSVHELQDL